MAGRIQIGVHLLSVGRDDLPMKTPNNGPAADETAMALFSFARQYHEAANCLFKEHGG
jgi:hypothetical protein